MEAYRSGHNGPDSKSGSPQGLVGSNPTASATRLSLDAIRVLCPAFSFSLPLAAKAKMDSFTCGLCGGDENRKTRPRQQKTSVDFSGKSGRENENQDCPEAQSPSSVLLLAQAIFGELHFDNGNTVKLTRLPDTLLIVLTDLKAQKHTGRAQKGELMPCVPICFRQFPRSPAQQLHVRKKPPLLLIRPILQLMEQERKNAGYPSRLAALTRRL